MVQFHTHLPPTTRPLNHPRSQKIDIVLLPMLIDEKRSQLLISATGSWVVTGHLPFLERTRAPCILQHNRIMVTIFFNDPVGFHLVSNPLSG